MINSWLTQRWASPYKSAYLQQHHSFHALFTFFVPCCIVVILMEIQQRKHNKTFFIFLTNPNLHIFTHYLLYTHSHTYKIHITHAHCRNYGLYNYTFPVIPIHALTCDFWVELLFIYDIMNILWITYIAFISRWKSNMYRKINIYDIEVWTSCTLLDISK